MYLCVDLQGKSTENQNVERIVIAHLKIRRPGGMRSARERSCRYDLALTCTFCTALEMSDLLLPHCPQKLNAIQNATPKQEPIEKKGLQYMRLCKSFHFTQKNKRPRPSHEEEQLEAFNIANSIARSANSIISYSFHMHCQSLKSKRTSFIRTAKMPLRWPSFI